MHFLQNLQFCNINNFAILAIFVIFFFFFQFLQNSQCAHNTHNVFAILAMCSQSSQYSQFDLQVHLHVQITSNKHINILITFYLIILQNVHTHRVYSDMLLRVRSMPFHHSTWLQTPLLHLLSSIWTFFSLSHVGLLIQTSQSFL